MSFTLLDALCIAISAVGFSTAAYRLARRWTNPAWSMTILTASLSAALLLRTPWLGDHILDNALHTATGWWNLPDLMGHLLVVIAIAAGVSYFAGALPLPHSSFRRPIITVILLIITAICVTAFIINGGYLTQTTDIVALDGMRSYSVAWSLGMMTWHLAAALVAWQLLRAIGPTGLGIVLSVSAGFGIAMSVHRIIVAIVPSLFDVAYDAIAWSLAILTVCSYLACIIMATLRVGLTPAGTSDDKDKAVVA